MLTSLVISDRPTGPGSTVLPRYSSRAASVKSVCEDSCARRGMISRKAGRRGAPRIGTRNRRTQTTIKREELVPVRGAQYQGPYCDEEARCLCDEIISWLGLLAASLPDCLITSLNKAFGERTLSSSMATGRKTCAPVGSASPAVRHPRTETTSPSRRRAHSLLPGGSLTLQLLRLGVRNSVSAPAMASEPRTAPWTCPTRSTPALR